MTKSSPNAGDRGQRAVVESSQPPKELRLAQRLKIIGAEIWRHDVEFRAAAAPDAGSGISAYRPASTLLWRQQRLSGADFVEKSLRMTGFADSLS